MTRYGTRDNLEGYLRDLQARLTEVERRPSPRVNAGGVPYTAIWDIANLAPNTRIGTIIFEISTGDKYEMQAGGPVLVP